MCEYDCCNECAAAVTQESQAGQTNSQDLDSLDTGPDTIVMYVCFDEKNGTTYPLNHQIAKDLFFESLSPV